MHTTTIMHLMTNQAILGKPARPLVSQLAVASQDDALLLYTAGYRYMFIMPWH